MPILNAANIPSIPPGDLFDRLLTDGSLNVRWLTPNDPCFYETLNRPTVDIALRQLIIAKAIDRINDNIGYLSIFPFLIQPKIQNGTQVADIPVRIFWDFHVSLPDKWSDVRLARVDRINGTNASDGDTGTLRFIFTGNERTDGTDSTIETALFYCDYVIDSTLIYQPERPHPATISAGISGFSAYLATGEANTIGGTVVFKTQDSTAADVSAFLQVAAPGSGDTSYETFDTLGNDASDGYSVSGLSHGTGLLASSAFNGIVSLDSDPLNWIEAFNYPFDLNATLISVDSAITIPAALFSEFNMTAPANDNPTGISDGTHYPVWIRQIARSGSNFVFTFSTYNITDSSPDPTTPVDFASLTLNSAMVGGQIIAIEPLDDLILMTGSSTDIANAAQHFGRGHVVLSRKWDSTGGVIDDFFSSLPEIPSGTTTVTFTQAATRISSYGLSRIPKYIPTKGQNQALAGTTGRNDAPIQPSDSNRFVTELDEGLGDAVDLEALSGVTPDPAIERFGYAATRSHKLVKMVVDQSKIAQNNNYYDQVLLPRLTALLGRAPVFGDVWFQGVRFLTFNGDSWQD